jgi:hypothetical protein
MAPRLPAPESVEFGDQCEKMVGGRVHVGRQRGDFVPEVEELDQASQARLENVFPQTCLDQSPIQKRTPEAPGRYQ